MSLPASKGPAQPKRTEQPELPITQSNPVMEFTTRVIEVKDAGTDIQSETLGPRRGRRERILTEKGKGFQDKKLKGLLSIFDGVYEHWKIEAKRIKRAVMDQAPAEDLQQKIDVLKKYLMALNETYEEYRVIEVPTSDLRRRIDKGHQVTVNLVQNAEALIQEAEGIEWPDVSSVFDTTTCSSPSINTNQTQAQTQEQTRHEEPKDKAEEVTATQNFLKIMAEQDEQQQRLTQMEAETLKHKKEMDRLKMEVERLEQLKLLNAAKANLQVPQANSTPERTQTQYPPPTQEGVNVSELVKVLAEAITANRLPIPEPATFNGDPLQYSMWKTSFQTLIERKNVPTAEKIFFLQRYIGGAAKEAIEGYFLSQTEEAYQAAWDLLEERYGNLFIIAKAYRDKLQGWAKITHKDGGELRKYVDFLRSCESAMTLNPHLNILNDAMENQRLVSKLPDGLIGNTLQ